MRTCSAATSSGESWYCCRKASTSLERVSLAARSRDTRSVSDSISAADARADVSAPLMRVQPPATESRSAWAVSSA